MFRGSHSLIAETDIVSLSHVTIKLLLRPAKFDFWLAGSLGSSNQSHACLMLMKKYLELNIPLSNRLGGTKESSTSDIGRLVLKQLSSGFNGVPMKPRRLFSGVFRFPFKVIGFLA